MLRPERERRTQGRRSGRHRSGPAEREIDQNGSGEIEPGKYEEIPGQTQMVGQPRRHQAPDQVTRDIARDIRGERAGRIDGAASLREVGQGQREGGIDCQQRNQDHPQRLP